MKIGVLHIIALTSWGGTAIMITPSFSGLIVQLINAILLATLVYCAEKRQK